MTTAQSLASVGSAFANQSLVPYNFIINPHGSIQQETATPQTLSAGSYFADQWIGFKTMSTTGVIQAGVASGSVSSFDPANMFIKTTTAQASLASGDNAGFLQYIEGLMFRKMLYGSSSAKGSWIHWRASASQAGTASIALRNAANNRCFVQSFDVTTTPTDYNLFVPGDTSGTWVVDNNHAVNLLFCFAAGTSSQTSTLGSWQSGGYIAANTQTNFAATLNAQLNITDVQWVDSAVKLPFIPVRWDDELKRCQRYFEKSYPYFVAVGSISQQGSVSSVALQSAILYFRNVVYKVSKRTVTQPLLYNPQTGASNSIIRMDDASNVSISNTSSESSEGCGNVYFGNNPLVANGNYNFQWVANARM